MPRMIASKEPRQIARGFAILWRTRTETSSLTFATLLLASGCHLKKVDYILCCSDDPRIFKLYKGLSCTEISVETGDFCNANRRCVMPSTPGDPESTCPNQAVRTIRRRKVEKRKKAKAKDRRKKGNRLVGASAQHTDVNLQLRYPWICSLKREDSGGYPKLITD